MAERQRLATSMGASALLHVFVIGSLFLLAMAPKRPLSIPSVDIDLASLPLPAARRPAAPAPPAPEARQEPPPQAVAAQPQIVDPSDAGEEKEPENARLLSDRNNTVPEEMVHRGDRGLDPNSTDRLFRAEPEPKPEAPVAEEPPPPEPPKAKAKPPQAAPRPRQPPPPAVAQKPKQRPPARAEPGDLANQRMAKLPSLDSLIPRAEDLARNQPLAPPSRQERTGRDLLNSGSQVFSGRPGTRDFLPRVAEGNISMLNTKADLFAPFVRRVAGRVFENLDLALRGFRTSRNAGSGRTVALVEAVMDRKGQFVRVEMKEQQGLNSVSRLLLDSAQPDTFFDANPPSGAEANDGLIHFQLLIDLTVDAAIDPRTGRSFNNYHGVAGVGLM